MLCLNQAEAELAISLLEPLLSSFQCPYQVLDNWERELRCSTILICHLATASRGSRHDIALLVSLLRGSA